MDGRTIQRQAFDCAVRRKKLNPKADWECVQQVLRDALVGEVKEFINAKGMSRHLTNRSEFAEELADVVITCMTIAEYNGINLDTIISEKMKYNQSRKD